MKIDFLRIKFLVNFSALILIAGMSHAATTRWQSADHIKARLISDVDILASDTTFYVGLELYPDEHWHVYWQNPGDSGMPVSMSWQLPNNITEQKQIWPIPKKIPFGDLTNFGYEGRVIIPVRMQSGSISETSKLQVKANWLVCKDSCIPGTANLELSLNSDAEEKTSSEMEEMQIFIEQEASELSLMHGDIKQTQNQLTIQLFSDKPEFKAANKIEFFPINEGLFNTGASTEIKWKNNFLSISQEQSENFYKIPESIKGLLVLDDKHAWEFNFNTQPE